MPDIVRGIITVWSGGLGNIPPGWHLCDGSAGTPDLREKFIPSAGPSFSVGEEGGFADHDHDLTTDGHKHISKGSYNLEPGDGVGGETSVETDTATTGVVGNLPPYYALAYIMYL